MAFIYIYIFCQFPHKTMQEKKFKQTVAEKGYAEL